MASTAAPRPKSPPPSPDPCGRHRLKLAVDALHREIGFLEGEINSIDEAHAASRCCKEIDEFVGKNPDPFITIQSGKRSNDQSQQFLKKSRGKSCLSYYLSWICCCGGSPTVQLRRPPASCCSCSCGPQLRRLCSSSSSCCCCCRCSRCRVVYAGCCCSCRAPCPRCSCDCTCSCPTCSCPSCASCCPTCGCSHASCCCLPRCCLC